MKSLISQNGVIVSNAREVRRFKCKDCGAVWDSDEYMVSNSTNFIFNNTLQEGGCFIIKDNCFTCRKECIIVEKVSEN